MKAAYVWPAVLALAGYAKADGSITAAASAPASGAVESVIDNASLEILTSYEVQVLTTEYLITTRVPHYSTIYEDGKPVSTVTASSEALSLTQSTSSTTAVIGTNTTSRSLTTSEVTSTVISTIQSCINNPSCTNGHEVTLTTVYTTTCPVTQTGDRTILVGTTTTAFLPGQQLYDCPPFHILFDCRLVEFHHHHNGY
ncbi:hypothetical protein G7Y89_g12983 [Cudoniella acicularis]|uniref:Uncharacterized protein n=1 Tax=Cudoniella acicularis TaxID=354080 RepID=A0A8H4RA65_9HELO|nr:hypothetical protein G7Y89_g12983 [Cudoniella acicularis]